MEYQKTFSNFSNFFNNTPNQPTKFRTKNWVEINDYARGTYNTNNQIKFKTAMLKSSLCDYSKYTCKWNYNSPKHRNSSKPKQ